MSRSYWNDDISCRTDESITVEENVSRRYNPAVESAPLKPPPYYSNVARFSEHVASVKKPPPPKTAKSKEDTPNGSQSKDPTSSVIKAVASSSSTETISTSPSTSDSSFLESLRAEEASCCPLCGFQAPATNTADPCLGNSQQGLPPSVWLRSFVAHQQEDLLKRCHSTESSSDITSSITDAFTPLLNKKLPSGTCWVCLQAANEAAKERQVEEDRLLAASLSKILLEEEQQNRPNESYIPPPDDYYNICEDTTGIHRQVTSISDYVSMPTVPTSVVITEVEDCIFQGDEISGNAHDDSCVYIGEYNILGQRHGSHGELIWDSGDRYVGTFENGMRSGQGAFFFRDGSEYTGDWKDDLMHGFGQHRFANGDTYVGEYHNGQRSGEKCKYKFSNSDLYVGGWKEDKFHGFGRYFYADLSVLEGNFFHGMKQGKFKRQLPTEDLDILRFEDDKIVGQGVRWNTKRTKTWLLEPRATNEIETRKSNSCRRTALRMVRGIGSLKFSRPRKTANNLPSSVGVSVGKETDGNDAIQNLAESTLLREEYLPTPSVLPGGNPVPLSPHESTKNLVKKSVRIPISQAVSIGYDCEIGTGKRPVAVTVE